MDAIFFNVPILGGDNRIVIHKNLAINQEKDRTNGCDSVQGARVEAAEDEGDNFLDFSFALFLKKTPSLRHSNCQLKEQLFVISKLVSVGSSVTWI